MNLIQTICSHIWYMPPIQTYHTWYIFKLLWHNEFWPYEAYVHFLETPCINNRGGKAEFSLCRLKRDLSWIFSLLSPFHGFTPKCRGRGPPCSLTMKDDARYANTRTLMPCLFFVLSSNSLIQKYAFRLKANVHF